MNRSPMRERSPLDDPPQENFEVEEEPLRSDKRFSSLPATPRRQRQRRPSVPAKFQEVAVLRWFVVALTVITIIVFTVLYFANSGKKDSREASAAAHTGSSYDTGFNMKQNWGSYSPYFDTGVPFDGVSRKALDGNHGLPPTCKLKQVHVLHRHGDRYPAEGTQKKMEKVADRLIEWRESHEVPEPLAWLKDWSYDLGEELLVGAGVGALFESGAKFWGSHGSLLYGNASAQPAWSDEVNKYPNGTQRPKPLIRATSQQRIQDSARAWAAGFFGTYGFPSSGVNPLDHYNLLLMEETAKNNNSMAGYFACPNSGTEKANVGKDLSNEWVDVYLEDAATRLQKVLPGIGNLTAPECLAIQDLCAFETAAFGASPFCTLFTEQEWRGFEYHADLKFWGESAWGSEIGPATGLPWLTELRGFLKHELIKKPQNGVNHTLASDPESFPVNQPFTADFTHDSVITSVLAALQFPFTKEQLTSHKIKVPRQMIMSRLTPFAARFYVEVLSCGTGSNAGDYVRLRLNDRVLPIGDLKFCTDDEKRLGLCPLHDFMKHLDFALKTDFDRICYGKENDTNN